MHGDLPDPFAPTVAAPVAGAPPAAAPSTEGGGPTPPAFVPETAYRELQAKYENLKPLENLRWVGELMADPNTAAAVRQAIFSAGAGAPPNVTATPPVDPKATENAIRAKYDVSIKQKLSVGDVAGAIADGAAMGAEISRSSMMPELQTAAGGLIGMTAQNTIESFYNQKRAALPDLFPKIEAKVRAFVAATPAATINALVQNGGLNAALETAFKSVLADSYVEGYTKMSGGQPTPTPPPPYSAGVGGGPPQPDTPTADDKDDAAFVAWAKERGITFTGGANGEIVGELK